MNRAVLALFLATAFAAPTAALAGGNGGDNQPAGGGFMSSYVSDPYHDPKSSYSQSRGTGQILGAPMLHEGAGHHAAKSYGKPHWASGTFGGRQR